MGSYREKSQRASPDMPSNAPERRGMHFVITKPRIQSLARCSNIHIPPPLRRRARLRSAYAQSTSEGWFARTLLKPVRSAHHQTAATPGDQDEPTQDARARSEGRSKNEDATQRAPLATSEHPPVRSDHMLLTNMGRLHMYCDNLG